jgi:hypothetical protein
MIFVIAIVSSFSRGIEMWDKITDHLASARVIVLSLVRCSRASLQPLDAKAIEHFKIALRFDVFAQRGNAVPFARIGEFENFRLYRDRSPARWSRPGRRRFRILVAWA